MKDIDPSCGCRGRLKSDLVCKLGQKLSFTLDSRESAVLIKPRSVRPTSRCRF